ncbi:flagellar biosynthesis anti-sigma factor FlgM [Novosphingobium sp. FSY-8]|uniref:Negative regulator of flagellin synthesis n=1 Tax=Novosphingobium ovatum TaxID=1908523 RepID=A0ABW9XG29_9SPHN|nr:flagellar biosynthesis anti-sigma factor FlgM [Novosphingobium ovatum]NBC37488.1 flagellar biosynthesis anti-sigma factor FlgM [Novosphingobium ovatum]
MASIGPGPGIGKGPQIEVGAARAISSTDTRAVSTDTQETAKASSAPAQSQAMVTTTALSAGQAPVDSERVATIRKAIESGNYPVIPTKISDAMIAAGMILRGKTA